MVLGLMIHSASAAVRIGNEARLQRTTDQEYFARMNRMPASNSVQRLNPPIFQYPYYEDPGSLRNLGHTRVFRLQLTTNGSFASPLWDITTSNIFYNFLPSITNADGSTWSNAVSWRVIYMNSNQTVNLYTNPVHTFTMPANAEKWDRGCFADKSPGGYLQSLSNMHPRILFKQTNLTAYRAFINNGTPYFGSVVGTSFVDFTNSITALNEPYWTTASATMAAYQWFIYVPTALAKLGGAYWGSTNEWFTNTINRASPSVGRVITNFMGQFEAGGYDRLSVYDGQIMDTVAAMGLMYDMWYHLMSASERAFTLRVMENCVAFQLYESWYFVGSEANTDRVYGGRNLAMNIPSVAVQQDSHGRGDRNVLAICLGGMGDSPKLDYYAQYFLGFWMGKYDGFDYSFEDPRVYGNLATFSDWQRFQPWPLAVTMFNDKKLTNAPVYTEMLDLLMHQTPLGFRSTMQPWGPAATQPFSTVIPFDKVAMGAMAHMNQRGDWWRLHKRAFEMRGGSPSAGSSYNWIVDTVASWYPTPAQADRNTNSYIDPIRGWAAGSGSKPTDYGVASNNVFFVFQARPTGQGRSGGHFSDGSIEIGAYGANVTAAGAGRYESAALLFNGLFVDGIGVNNSSPRSPYPVHARFDAYTNWGDGLYVRADLTYAFNLTNNLGGGGTANLQSTLNSAARVNYLQASNARPYISSIKRSILFPHNKYFVIYDELQTTRPAQFQWKWNAFPTNCTAIDANLAFNYTMTNNWPGRPNVTTYVKHIVSPNLMGVTQMVNKVNVVGTNEFCYAKMNPFTGEKYNYTNDWIGVGNDYQDYYWANTFWIYNKTPTTNWHFLSVVYPVKSGETAPTITRLDDYTVRVQKGVDDDIITFNTNSAYADQATLIVAVPGIAVTTRLGQVANPIRYFDELDFIDPVFLAVKLSTHTDPLSLFLWNQLLPQEQQVLANRGLAPTDLAKAAKDGLNRIVRGNSIYEPQRFAGFTLSTDTLNLMAQNPQGTRLRLLNRMLLCDAYPEAIRWQ